MKKRRPTRAAMEKFMRLWNQAQKANDARRMLQLLEPKFLNYWWAAYVDSTPGQVWQSTCKTAIEITLEKLGLIGTTRERPSERAMALTVRHE